MSGASISLLKVHVDSTGCPGCGHLSGTFLVSFLSLVLWFVGCPCLPFWFPLWSPFRFGTCCRCTLVPGNTSFLSLPSSWFSCGRGENWVCQIPVSTCRILAWVISPPRPSKISLLLCKLSHWPSLVKPLLHLPNLVLRHLQVIGRSLVVTPRIYASREISSVLGWAIEVQKKALVRYLPSFWTLPGRSFRQSLQELSFEHWELSVLVFGRGLLKLPTPKPNQFLSAVFVTGLCSRAQPSVVLPGSIPVLTLDVPSKVTSGIHTHNKYMGIYLHIYIYIYIVFILGLAGSVMNSCLGHKHCTACTFWLKTKMDL